MSAQPFRLATGGAIDRGSTTRFAFDGEAYAGHPGDTLASALLANGVRLMARSFKYHRPRGALTAGPEEPNALVELRTGARREPNTRATAAELYDGLEARSQNRWPSLQLDVLALNGLAAPVLGAGFYYKTFMWPRAFWERVYEPAIRRAAGLGRAADAADPDTYEKVHAFCDVLVIGSGPAGLAAALAARRAGARVILCEEDFSLGGRLIAEAQEIDGAPASAWAEAAEGELRADPKVRVLQRTCVFGVFDGGEYGALEKLADHLAAPAPGQPRQRLWKIVARRAVLASGALERPLVFPGNDRPGVMLAGAARAYAHRFAVAPGRRAVVYAASDDAWRTAADLAAAGVDVAAVVDPRPDLPASLRQAAERIGAEVLVGGTVMAALGAPCLRRVEVRAASGRIAAFRCDLLAMGGGWTPLGGLASNLGHRLTWSPERQAFLPLDLPPGMAVAGAVAGALTLTDCLADGVRRGAEGAADAGFHAPSSTPLRGGEEAGAGPAYWPRPGTKGMAFLDFQNDVTAKDVELAVREGYRSVEHVKRYTTLGMATDQGKTSNLNAHALTAQLSGLGMEAAGAVISRPPHQPVAIAAFAGHSRGLDFRPTRHTPAHAWALAHGAVMTDSGAWKRASYFPRQRADGPVEDWLQAAVREAAAVRAGVGVCDVSTLGKIDIQGPDAGALLDRLYANRFSNLAVGRARYGLMLREDGLVLDDGTSARLAEDRWVMSTTTANAARVMQHLDFARQVLWPTLDVQAISVSEQWAQFAVAGPRSRELLQALFGPTLDLSNRAFPYMAVAEVRLGETPVRLFRLSFSGELAFEVAVPAQYGLALARTLMAAGGPFGVTPYGLEALSILRIEKGHPAGGELNGQVTAGDLGLGGLMSRKKDFIGRVLAGRPGLIDPDRPTLVGLRACEPSQRLRTGAHLLAPGVAATAEADAGYVTSTAYSPALGGWIGLGLLRRGPTRHGEVVRAYDPLRGGDGEVVVCPPVFVDPEGGRLRG